MSMDRLYYSALGIALGAISGVCSGWLDRESALTRNSTPESSRSLEQTEELESENTFVNSPTAPIRTKQGPGFSAIEPRAGDRARGRYRIRAQILREGQPVAGTGRATAWSWDGKVLDTCVCAGDGRVELQFHAPPDQGSVVLACTGDPTGGSAQEIFLASPSEFQDLDPIELQPPGKISIYTGELEAQSATLRASAWPTFLAPYGQGRWPSQLPDPELPGEARRLPSMIDLRGIFGPLWRIELTVGESQRLQWSQIVLAAEGARCVLDDAGSIRSVAVAGHATRVLANGSEEPAPKAKVELVVGRLEGAGTQTAETDHNGSFEAQFSAFGALAIEARVLFVDGTGIAFPLRTRLEALSLAAETLRPKLLVATPWIAEAPHAMRGMERPVMISAIEEASGERLATWRTDSTHRATVAVLPGRKLRWTARRQGEATWFSMQHVGDGSPGPWQPGASLRLAAQADGLPEEVVLEGVDAEGGCLWRERATWRLSASPGWWAIQLHSLPPGPTEIRALAIDRNGASGRILRRASAVVGEVPSVRLTSP